MRHFLFPFILLLGIFIPTHAKIILPHVFSDNMVLQQSASVKLWGTAKGNTVVSIKCSWTGKIVTARSDTQGRWSAYVVTPSANYSPQTLTISDGDQLVLRNILIGEVWICSGQSNMEITLNGFWNCPIADANEMIAEAGQYKGIRCMTVEKHGASTPQNDVHGGIWQISDTQHAPGFSATAYHFAIMLHKVLKVPVGILVCSWGGSTVEGWLPEQILKTYKDVDLSTITSSKGTEWLKPEIMYNGMLHPIEGFTARGFLWYQGESNVGHHDTYPIRLSTMTELWRKEWGQRDMPFYIVEIAPFQYGEGDWAAYFREAQQKAATMIPNSGIVCTNDLVEPYEQNNIHPKNKKDIGNRLAFLALVATYKIPGIEAYGPSYKSMEIKEGKAILSFYHAQDGFNRLDGMEGFEIAGADKVFHKAKARMLNNQNIEVISDDVPIPVSVRYCFHNYMPGNVKNTRGLPLFPFRTDDW